MDKLSNSGRLHCELMANGVICHSVEIRGLETADDFEVVITDQLCGAFAIHEGFDLRVRKESTWRPVTLLDLKKVLRESGEFSRILDIQNSSEMAELRLFSQFWNDVDSREPSLRRMDWITAYDRCVRRVKALLREVAIPSVPCGGVFVVPNRARARTVLLSAGFQPSSITAGALVEPFSGCAVCLVEGTSVPALRGVNVSRAKNSAIEKGD